MLIAVDTGGTKTLVASFSQDGSVQASEKFPTPQDQAAYLIKLTQTIQDIAKQQTIDGIVVALPGIVKDGIAVWCNHLLWKDFDVRTPLAMDFPDVPILVENDANLGGLAETRGLAEVPRSALYVTISTGIGTGVITEGQIDPGLRLSEGGRSLVEFDGQVREWESFAAGSAIYKTFGAYARDITDPATWQQIADRISRGFLAIIPFLQPDVVIIGGGVGTSFDHYRVYLENILTQALPPHIPCPTFIAAAHPEEAVIYGCYYYALDALATADAA